VVGFLVVVDVVVGTSVVVVGLVVVVDFGTFTVNQFGEMVWYIFSPIFTSHL
jgi:hypothetical protein